jgi:hypothetical protein
MRPIPSESSDPTATRIVAIWAAECVAALLLLLQRVTGSLEEFPSPTAVLLFAVVCLAANLMAVALFRAFLFSRDSKSSERSALLRKAFESRLNGAVLLAIACLPPLVIGLSLLHPDATGERAALWAWVMLSMATAAWMSRRRRQTRTETDDAPRAGGVSPPHQPLPGSVPAFDAGPVAASDAMQCDNDADPAGATRPRHASAESDIVGFSEIPGKSPDPPLQWMQRRLSEDGLCETVEGEFTAAFAAGQKQAVVHLAFCPPLPSVPELECEPLDGADVRWKLAVAQPYGVRIDVHRGGALDSPAEIRLAWFATVGRHITEAA